jgi:hypothetical protein
MTVQGIGFSDILNLAQTIGIVVTSIMTLALATTY